jgi:hypothetical protein
LLTAASSCRQSYHQNEAIQIIYQKKIIIGINNTKFLGLELDKSMSWKNHVQKILPKLRSACYLARRMYPCCKSNALGMIYFAYFDADMEHGIIFWGDSVESKRIFQKQKRIIRIMTGCSSRISCGTLFQKLLIFTLTSLDEVPLIKFGNLQI